VRLSFISKGSLGSIKSNAVRGVLGSRGPCCDLLYRYQGRGAVDAGPIEAGDRFRFRQPEIPRAGVCVCVAVQFVFGHGICPPASASAREHVRLQQQQQQHAFQLPAVLRALHAGVYDAMLQVYPSVRGPGTSIGAARSGPPTSGLASSHHLAFAFVIPMPPTRGPHRRPFADRVEVTMRPMRPLAKRAKKAAPWAGPPRHEPVGNETRVSMVDGKEPPWCCGRRRCATVAATCACACRGT